MAWQGLAWQGLAWQGLTAWVDGVARVDGLTAWVGVARSLCDFAGPEVS